MSPKHLILAAISLFANIINGQSTLEDESSDGPAAFSFTILPDSQPSQTAVQAPEITASSIVYVFIDTGPQTLYASVITANTSMTAYAFENPPVSLGSWDGNFDPPGANLTVINDNTWIMTYSDPSPEELYEVCTSFNPKSVVCSYSWGGDYTSGTDPGPTLQTLPTEWATLIPLTITAGFEKLSDATASPTLSVNTASKSLQSSKSSTDSTPKKTGSTGSSGTSQVQCSMLILVSVLCIIANL